MQWETFLCRNRQGVGLHSATNKEFSHGNENQRLITLWNGLQDVEKDKFYCIITICIYLYREFLHEFGPFWILDRTVDDPMSQIES